MAMKLKLPFDLAAMKSNLYAKAGMRTPEQKKRFRREMLTGLIIGTLVGANIVATGYGRYFFGILCLVMVVFEIYFHRVLAKEFDDK